MSTASADEAAPAAHRGDLPQGRPLVVLDGVDKHFGDLHVLKDVDLAVHAGEVVVVIGPSGSGKSTPCRALRLLDRGQFAAEPWAPLLDPRTEEFPQVWALIGSGLWLTLRAAAVAMVALLAIGFVVVVVRLSLGRRSRLPVVALVELLRGLPVVAIALAAALLPAIGIDVDAFWYLVVVLTAYSSVVVSEVLRAGVVSLPRGQVEAALAVGLSRGQTMRLVQLPQAVRAVLPALISQLVVILKDATIGSIVLIGLEDVLHQGNAIRRVLDNPLPTYAVIAVIFIVLNLLLSHLAVLTERRLSRSSTSDEPDPEVVAAGAASTAGA